MFKFCYAPNGPSWKKSERASESTRRAARAAFGEKAFENKERFEFLAGFERRVENLWLWKFSNNDDDDSRAQVIELGKICDEKSAFFCYLFGYYSRFDQAYIFIGWKTNISCCYFF